MVQVNKDEIQRDLAAYLERVKAGEIVIIVDEEQPLAELRPVGSTTDELRPYGLCAGDFVVPDDFDEPLPDDLIDLFSGQ